MLYYFDEMLLWQWHLIKPLNAKTFKKNVNYS